MSGTVQETRQFTLNGHQEAHTFAKVQTRQGKIVVVDLGPTDQIGQLSLSSGTKIQVRGYMVAVNQRPVLMAGQLQVGDQTIDIPRSQGARQQGDPGAADAALGVQQSQRYGPYLTDAQGRAVYMLEADPNGQGTCTGRCVQVWPPVVAPQGSIRAGAPAVQGELIGAIRRQDGLTQATYNGHPLYYYAKDQGPGRTTGHDVRDEWGLWSLLTPQGQPAGKSE